jgi:hypothetical protein
MFNIRQIDLSKLNSLTKYPSILTYHKLGDKGKLLPELQVDFGDEIVVGTEKIDGTNARVIVCPDGSILVGSREDLLWESHDLIGNNVMGIVDALKPLVVNIAKYNIRSNYGTHQSLGDNAIQVLFFEVYGKNIGANAKQYSGTGEVGYRLFDAFRLTNYQELLELSPGKIASWRDNGGQPFEDAHYIPVIANRLGVDTVPRLFLGGKKEVVASLDVVEISTGLCRNERLGYVTLDMPTELEATYKWLLAFGKSQATLDDKANSVPEGIVVRTLDRKKIAKIRREDYERTLRKKN